jgi:PhnB protein
VNQVYGDREASVTDPAGNPWYIATRLSTKLSASGERSYVPAGLRSITPFLHLRGAAAFIEFVSRSFAAEVIDRMQADDGTIHYAMVKVGDSRLELSEAHGDNGPLPAMFYLYVGDADVTYRQALAAGATSVEKPADQNYGHRRAAVMDAFGIHWYPASSLVPATR